MLDHHGDGACIWARRLVPGAKLSSRPLDDVVGLREVAHERFETAGLGFQKQYLRYRCHMSLRLSGCCESWADTLVRRGKNSFRDRAHCYSANRWGNEEDDLWRSL